MKIIIEDNDNGTISLGTDVPVTDIRRTLGVLEIAKDIVKGMARKQEGPTIIPASPDILGRINRGN